MNVGESARQWSSSEPDLLVVGGGIGGLAAALCLARLGRTVQVLEQAPAFGEIGAGLQLAPNAARILDWLGLLDPVMKDAFFPSRIALMDALTSAEITVMATGEGFRARYGYPYFVTHRADLHSVLVEACELEDGIELHPGKKVVVLDQTPGAVRVECEDGSAFTATALIGADGIRSFVRDQLVGDGEPVSTGYVAYRATVPIQVVQDAMGIAELDDVRCWIGPTMHLVQYPIRGGDLCNQVAVFRSRRLGDGGAGAGAPDELDEVFSQASEQVAGAVGLMDRDRCWPMFDREPGSGWVRGNVALLGDAAHPMFQYLAQGACQAMEDAVVLAQSVSSHPDIGAAFDSYVGTRHPRASAVQRRSRMFGELLHVNGTMAAFRDHMLRRRPDTDYGDVDWLYGHSVLH